jgi:hypothetical protein
VLNTVQREAFKGIFVGEDISFARLRLQPTTRYTVEALEQLELERARARVVGPDDDEKAY